MLCTAAGASEFHGIIAVDGPSGAGKSTVSRLLASRLGARYLDTGAMYRAVTWAVLSAGVPVDDVMAVTELVGRIRLDVNTDPNQPEVAVDGRSVDDEIRSGSVTTAVSAVSAVPEVRRRLTDLQRQLIGAGGIVVEGRDIGSVVAPGANLKVFLTASTSARAGRRSSQLGASGRDELAATAADLTRRDSLDRERVVSPFQPASDAVLVDTTQLAIAEVVARLFELATRSARDESAPSS